MTLYQANLYYGVHYGAELFPYVTDALLNTEYRGLSTDPYEYRGKHMIVAGGNGNVTATRGYIYVPHMSKIGPEFLSPQDCYVPVEPTDLDHCESRHEQSCDTIIDIYNLIVAHLKKMEVRETVHLGWGCAVCEWVDEAEDADNTTNNTTSNIDNAKDKNTTDADTDTDTNSTGSASETDTAEDSTSDTDTTSDTTEDTDSADGPNPTDDN